MKEIALSTLRAGNIVAVQLEQTELADCRFWVVTTRESTHRPPTRRWYPDEAQALAYAAEQADRHGLLLFDLRGSEPE